MKKCLLYLLLFLPLILRAQYGREIVSAPGSEQYVFLGSLPVSNEGNLHKLKVDILGGAWDSYSTGETTFFIANRGGLSIKEVTLGSGNAGRYDLHAYNNASGGIDFYLFSNSFSAFAIKSVVLGNNATQLVSNTLSSSPPAGLTEILPLTITPVLVTGYDGNLGINTFAPDPNYKLSVNGAVRAKEVKVDAGWSDYVFYDDYRLRPLSEVGTYILKYRHLPDVPSAQQVEKEGVSIGQTSALLLRKIEELTLYLLKKDQEIRKQQNSMRRQQLLLDRQQKQLNALGQQVKNISNH